MKPIAALLLTAALPFFASCTDGGGNTAVPRQHAYPRIALCDTVYRVALADRVPGGLRVNAESRVELIDSTRQDGSLWFDIVYPTYGGLRINCTYRPAADADELRAIVANRLQRMRMNISTEAQRYTDLSKGGENLSVVLTSLSQTMTPVQFLDVRPEGVVSGALSLEISESSKVDSLMPVIRAIERDAKVMSNE